MRIVICASINFTNKIKEVSDILLNHGHEVEMPLYSQKILNGEVSLEDFIKLKQKNGDMVFRKKSKEDLIKRYFRLIRNSDAVLVVNVNKKGVENYIGGNTFLEMGFAHILDKAIYLLNSIPEIGYKDEIEAMRPMILNGDLKKINQSKSV